MRSVLLKGFIVTLLIGTLGLANSACADDNWTEVSDLESFHLDLTWANDLHITFDAGGPRLVFKSSVDDEFTTCTATPNEDNTEWTCVWSGHTFHNCEYVAVGVTFDVECGNILNKTNIHWTQDFTPVGDFLPGAGFSVDPWSGSGPITYSARNSTSVPFTISDLQFRISSVRTSLEEMIYPLPGFGPARDPMILNPGESWDTTFFPERTGTYYVMAQGVVNGPTGEGNFVQQHEHPITAIPTLTEWGLIIFGVVLLGFITWVFLRRRKAVVSLR